MKASDSKKREAVEPRLKRKKAKASDKPAESDDPSVIKTEVDHDPIEDFSEQPFTGFAE